MQLCPMSKCVFKRYADAATTTSLKQAMEWHQSGYCVQFTFDGEYIGSVAYAGSISKIEHLPSGADYALVFYCEEDGEFYINIPDRFFESMPEE